jgi:hypothetical protein
MANNPSEPEQPRAAPEIIPPDRTGGRLGWPPNGYSETNGTHRIYVNRIGPFGFALLMLVVGLFAGLLLLVLIGAALIWIPVVAVFVLIAAISGVFRRR